MQHCEVTMVNAQFAKHVAHLESKEGCPITPGASLSKVFMLNPSAKNNKDKRGIALDGHLRVSRSSNWIMDYLFRQQGHVDDGNVY